jgi:hypothetical protein
LLSALDHVLGGRTFVPSLTSLFEVTGVGHTVQFHEQDHFALDEASEFLSAALGSGEPVAVIHSEQTLKDISRRLRERKLNLPAMAAKGQYVEMDSSKALLQIMRDGRPDPDFVARIVQDLNRIRIYAGGPQSRLNLWGAISPFLCRDGNFEAALEIERMWSKLTRDLPFLTVCAYPIECFHAGGSEESFANVCAEHGVVNHAYA